VRSASMWTISGLGQGIVHPWSQSRPASLHLGSVPRVKAALRPPKTAPKHGTPRFSPQRHHTTRRHVEQHSCKATAPSSAWASPPQDPCPSSNAAAKVRGVAGMLVACLLAVAFRKLLTLLALGSRAPEMACLCAVGFLSTPALREAHWRIGSASISPGEHSDQHRAACTRTDIFLILSHQCTKLNWIKKTDICRGRLEATA